MKKALLASVAVLSMLYASAAHTSAHAGPKLPEIYVGKWCIDGGVDETIGTKVVIDQDRSKCYNEGGSIISYFSEGYGNSWSSANCEYVSIKRKGKTLSIARDAKNTVYWVPIIRIRAACQSSHAGKNNCCRYEQFELGYRNDGVLLYALMLSAKP